MSKMKSMLGMYALAAMAMSGDLGGNNRERYIKPKETNEEKNNSVFSSPNENSELKEMKELNKNLKKLLKNQCIHEIYSKNR